MKTVKFTESTNAIHHEGRYGTSSDIYADGTQCHSGDGRQGEDIFCLQRCGKQVGVRVIFLAQHSDRKIEGEIIRVENNCTGARTIEIEIKSPAMPVTPADLSRL